MKMMKNLIKTKKNLFNPKFFNTQLRMLTNKPQETHFRLTDSSNNPGGEYNPQ